LQLARGEIATATRHGHASLVRGRQDFKPQT
jgi:hypothetical protein